MKSSEDGRRYDTAHVVPSENHIRTYWANCLAACVWSDRTSNTRTPTLLYKGNKMLRNSFNALAKVVHVACQAERHGVSFFVLGDDDSEKRAEGYVRRIPACWLAAARRCCDHPQ
jgi:hypothetical protein